MKDLLFACICTATFGLSVQGLLDESPKNLSTNKTMMLIDSISNPLVDYASFEKLTKQAGDFRQKRLVSIEAFKLLASDDNTIILDTRSKEMYDRRHIKGAIHLNFSDFTADKLAQLIPDVHTRILIYCNNNFVDDPRTFALKSPPLALNIPTFINLYGYGYKNIYELGEVVSIRDERIQYEGSDTEADLPRS